MSDPRPAPPTCGHAYYDLTDNEAKCRECGHTWTEHRITISDLEYDLTLALMAATLDNK